MRVCLTIIVIWMNILHLVNSKREPSPAVQKLKATCKDTATCPVTFPEDDLKDRLTPLQYRVTQNRGTERYEKFKTYMWTVPERFCTWKIDCRHKLLLFKHSGLTALL